MKLFKIFGVVIGFAIISFASCQPDEPTPIVEEEDKPYVTTPYEAVTPRGFPKMIIPDDNQMTMEGVALGRMLAFYPMQPLP